MERNSGELIEALRRSRRGTPQPGDEAIVAAYSEEDVAAALDFINSTDWMTQPESGMGATAAPVDLNPLSPVEPLRGGLMDAPDAIGTQIRSGGNWWDDLGLGPAAVRDAIYGRDNGPRTPTPEESGPGFDWEGMAAKIAQGWFPGSDRKQSLTPSTEPSVADRVNTTGGINADRAASAPELGTQVTVPTPTTVPTSLTPTTGDLSLGGVTVPARTLPADRGGGADRRAERRGAERTQEDWPSQERNIRLGSTQGAFGGVDPAMASDVLRNPDVAASILAESQGGGAATAATMTPLMENASRLASLGLLGSGRGNRPPEGQKRNLFTAAPDSDVSKLQAAENWINQLNAPGAEPNVGHMARHAMRLARNTPVESFVSEGQDAGSPGAQVALTNGAIKAAVVPGSASANDKIDYYLNRASREYLKLAATGQLEIGEDGAPMSYPAYLRSIGAQRWLGGGR